MGRFSTFFNSLGRKAQCQISWLSYKAGLRLSFSRLKRLGVQLARKGRPFAYEELIRSYDPQVIFPESYACERFVGFNGVGQGTLDSFRAVRSSGGRLLFEKIYRADSSDWVKAEFFFRHHRGQIVRADINVPGIMDVRYGKVLTVAFFDHVDIKCLPEDLFRQLALKCIAWLGQLSPVSEAPAALSDLMLHDGFVRCLRKTREFAKTVHISGESLDKGLARVIQMPRFVAHGDLTLKNTASPNIVLDWDNFGYFPPGFDLAMYMARLQVMRPGDQFDAVARKYHPLFATRCSLEDFHFALLFFLLVFSKNRAVDFKLKLLEYFVEISAVEAEDRADLSFSRCGA